MASTMPENAPLLPNPSSSSQETRPRQQRNVTFNVNPVSRSIEPAAQHPDERPGSSPAPTPSHSSGAAAPGGPPMFAALNSKLRRRHSQSGPSATPPNPPMAKSGAQRSTKNAQKLKILPNPEVGEDGPDEESGRDVYSQYTRIKDPTARRDAARLGKADRDKLPRVTAYCTANTYQMENLMRFLKGRGKTRGAMPKLIDECIYTPYSYDGRQVEVAQNERKKQQQQEVHSNPVHPFERRHSTGGYSSADAVAVEGVSQEDLIDLRHEGREHAEIPPEGYETLESSGRMPDTFDAERGDESAIADAADFDIQVVMPEVFLFEYGVVVIWGMSVAQEQRFLKELAKFELEKLAQDDMEMEEFNHYYTREYQARIYNDYFALTDKKNYMTKLAISHALGQSVKTSLFEELISSTIEDTKDIPAQIALTGKIALSRTQIHKQIGELFILKLSIHLNGSILDTPELFWAEPQLEPVYQAVRSYLEMDQRVGLLQDRLEVLSDLLAVLKDQLSHGHGEKLEWIVIVLIAAEIAVAAINIVVDLYAGVD